MITNYAKIDMMRLLLLSLLIVMPLFLMLSSILTMASATSNIGAIPEIVSDVTSGEIAPVLLAPMATSGNNVYISWWEDYGNGTRVPFFKASNDNGVTFSSVLSLSDIGPLPVQNTNTN